MEEQIKNAVDNAFGDNVADMQSDIESALQYKIINALEAKRIEIARSLIANESVDPDEDEEDLEEELKGKQEKLDVNKNKKLDAQDFKLLRKGKKAPCCEGWDDDDEDADVAKADRELKRMKAKPIAAAKIDPDKDKIKKTKKDREEEMDEEYIEELSKKTLGSYVKKSANDIGYKAFAGGLEQGDSALPQPRAVKYTEKAIKRQKGINKAVNKLTKESYIEEKLDASMGVKKYIDDFIKSDNPKFQGKSKKERIEMALGAYYSAKKGKTRNEGVEDDFLKTAQEVASRHGGTARKVSSTEKKKETEELFKKRISAAKEREEDKKKNPGKYPKEPKSKESYPLGGYDPKSNRSYSD